MIMLMQMVMDQQKKPNLDFLHLSCQTCNIAQQKRGLLKFWMPQICFNKVAEQDAFTFLMSEMYLNTFSHEINLTRLFSKYKITWR